VIALAQPASFEPQIRCWVCGGSQLQRIHETTFDYEEYRRQDPALARYSGERVWLARCAGCGFGQPDRLPTLPHFFARMYDQRWSDEWVQREATATYKDLIFKTILKRLGDRLPPGSPRRLLDVGAHAGRFMWLAQRDGWSVEGIEVNPATAACAAHLTGAPVHRVSIEAFAGGARFTAVTMTDVLEHIPNPVEVLRHAARVLAPGGVIAVKVPSGPGQWSKERMRAAVRPAYRMSLADNLVHVNHFSSRSLKMALERAGFQGIRIEAGAPEMRCDGPAWKRLAANSARLALYGAACVARARSPLTLNLQAYARVPER
jgi:SAM-dependent methyltransferase